MDTTDMQLDADAGAAIVSGPTAREDVEDFMARATAAADAGACAQWLESVQDTLLNRTDLDDGERTALLHRFCRPVVELHAGRGKEVRVFVVKFIEAIAKGHYEHLPEVLPSIYALANDEDDTVQRHVLQAGVHVYRRTLAHIAVNDVRDDVRATWDTVRRLKESLCEQLSAKNDILRCAAVKFVESVVLAHSKLTVDPNLVKTSAVNKRRATDGADTFTLRDVPRRHELLKADELRAEGRNRLEDLVHRCCQACGVSPPAEEGAEDGAPPVTYDNPFSQKNLVVCLNLFSAVGTHRAGLVEIILPGMLAMHKGLTAVVAGDAAGAAGDDGLTASLNAKQAKSVSNMNRNNMLKLLKFTSSVQWHEPLVAALTELGAKEKAEKARDLSSDAAVMVRPLKRPLSPQSDREDGGKHARYQDGESAEVYVGPWPPRRSSLIMPNDYATLEPRQIMALVKENMKHLPPPPPPIYPGAAERTDPRVSLKKLMDALARIAYVFQRPRVGGGAGAGGGHGSTPGMHPGAMGGAVAANVHWGTAGAVGAAGVQDRSGMPPLRLPGDTLFEKPKAEATLNVAPFKRVLHARSPDDGDDGSGEGDFGASDALHAQLVGRILGIANQGLAAMDIDDDDDAKGAAEGGKKEAKQGAAAAAKANVLEDTVVEMVGRFDSSDLAPSTIFELVTSALYQRFTLISTEDLKAAAAVTPGTSAAAPPSAPLTAYTRLLLRIMRAMPQRNNRQKNESPRLTKLLLDAPMVPDVVLREVMDQWCEAAGEAGERDRLTVGLVTLRELILHRSALRVTCLRAALQYTATVTTGGGETMLRETCSKMVANTLFLRNEPVSAEIERHAFTLLRAEPETMAAAMAPQDEVAGMTADDAANASRKRLDFFCKLCRKRPAMFQTLLKVYVEIKDVLVEAAGAAPAAATPAEMPPLKQGRVAFCTWVEEQCPKLAMELVGTFARQFTQADREEAEIREQRAEEEKANASGGVDGAGGESADGAEKDADANGKAGDEEDQEEEDGGEKDEEAPKVPPLVRAAVAVANLLREDPNMKAFKPVALVLKAVAAPSRVWKGPSPELVEEMRGLYELYNRDHWIMIFALPGMPRDEALGVVADVVSAAGIKKGQKATSRIRGALDALLDPASPAFAPVTPTDLMVSLHRLPSAANKSAMAAIDYCLESRLKGRFTSEVLMEVISRLMKRENEAAGSAESAEAAPQPKPLPKLLLRLVILSVRLRPSLKDFSLQVVGQLVQQKIWETQPALWKGCTVVVAMSGAEAAAVCFTMPRAQLEPLLQANQGLMPMLTTHLAELDDVARGQLNEETVKFVASGGKSKPRPSKPPPSKPPPSKPPPPAKPPPPRKPPPGKGR